MLRLNAKTPGVQFVHKIKSLVSFDHADLHKFIQRLNVFKVHFV